MTEMETGIVARETASLGDEIVGRIGELAKISETSEHLTRIFLSKEHRAAADLILDWMRVAGMRAMRHMRSVRGTTTNKATSLVSNIESNAVDATSPSAATRRVEVRSISQRPAGPGGAFV